MHNYYYCSSQGLQPSRQSGRQWIHGGLQRRAADLSTFRDPRRGVAGLHDLEAHRHQHHEERLPWSHLHDSKGEGRGEVNTLYCITDQLVDCVFVVTQGNEPLQSLSSRANLSTGFVKGNNPDSQVQPRAGDKVSE